MADNTLPDYGIMGNIWPKGSIMCQWVKCEKGKEGGEVCREEMKDARRWMGEDTADAQSEDVVNKS